MPAWNGLLFTLFLIAPFVCATSLTSNLEDVLSFLPNGGGNCTKDKDCGGYFIGVCENNTCACSSSYTGSFCEYKRKSKLTAFLLDFFLGSCGAGQFYLGRTGIAVGILVLLLSTCFVVLPITLVLAYCCARRSFMSTLVGPPERGSGSGEIKAILGIGLASQSAGSCMKCGMFCLELLIVVVGIWWFVNWVLIVAGKTADGNGVPLANDI